MVDRDASRMSATASQRSARINAFRARIDGLRATSRAYDLPSCGRSVNTLGSGSTLESGAASAGRWGGGPGGGEGRSPRGSPGDGHDGDRARAPNPFDDDSSDDGDSDGSEVSDDDDEGSIEVNAAPVRRLPPPRARPNPFLDDGDGSDFPSGGDLFADSSDYEDVETSNIPAMRRAGPNPFVDGSGDGRVRSPPNPFDDSSDDESIPNREAEKSYGAGQPTAEQDDDSLSDAPGSFRESPPRLTSSPAGAKDKGDGGLLLRGWSSPRPAPEPSVGPAGPPRAPDRPSGLSPPTPGGHSQGTGSTYSSGGFEISSVEDGSASGSYFSGSGRNSDAGSPAGRREDSGSPKIRLGNSNPFGGPSERDGANPLDSPSELENRNPFDPFDSPSSGGGLVLSMEGRSYRLSPSVASPARVMQAEDGSGSPRAGDRSGSPPAGGGSQGTGGGASDGRYERGISNSLTVYEESVASSSASPSPAAARPGAAAAHAAITSARAMLLAASNGRWSDGGPSPEEGGRSGPSPFGSEGGGSSVPDLSPPGATMEVEYPPSPALPAAAFPNVVVGNGSVSSGSASTLSVPPPAMRGSPNSGGERAGAAAIALEYPPSPDALFAPMSFPDVGLDSPDEGDPWSDGRSADSYSMSAGSTSAAEAAMELASRPREEPDSPTPHLMASLHGSLNASLHTSLDDSLHGSAASGPARPDRGGGGGAAARRSAVITALLAARSASRSVSTSPSSDDGSAGTGRDPTNPFARVLALRKSLKDMTDRRLAATPGGLDSSTVDGTISTSSAASSGAKVTASVTFDGESVDGMIFDDLMKAKERARRGTAGGPPAVTTSTSDESLVSDEDTTVEGAEESGRDCEAAAAGIRSPVVVNAASADMSSLHHAESGEDLFAGDSVHEDKKSKTTKNDDGAGSISSEYAAAIEAARDEVRSLRSIREEDSEKGEENDDDGSSGSSVGTEQLSNRADACIARRSGASGSEVNLVPPRRRVLPSSPGAAGGVPAAAAGGSDGSVSTRDSKLGLTISVDGAGAGGAAALAAERVYLEGLKAQCLAELRVHAADEEIRHALGARLEAIRQYYQRRAGVVQLHPAVIAGGVGAAVVADRTSRAGYEARVGAIPTVESVAVTEADDEAEGTLPAAPTVTAEEEEDEDGVILVRTRTDTVGGEDGSWSGSQDSPADMHGFAIARAQSNIDKAVRAAHTSYSTNPNPFDDSDDDEEGKASDGESEAGAADRQAAAFGNAYTEETCSFWEDDEILRTATSTVGTGVNPHAVVAPGTRPTLSPDVRLPRTAAVLSAWNYYATINWLLFEGRRYDYEFRRSVASDPLYPYLASLVGIADGGDDGRRDEEKMIGQRPRPARAGRPADPARRVCEDLCGEAASVLPELSRVCADLGRRLGLKNVLVGPVKKPEEALAKAERKYGGDPLLVTDYCRASLFVKDVATLLALIEVVLSRYSKITKRIKLSNVKDSHRPLAGGYRDVKLNLDLDGHVCEVQVHLVPLWLVNEEAGFGHYRLCREHDVDDPSFDVGRTLRGLDRRAAAEIIRVGEDSVRDSPADALGPDDEGPIRDHFALSRLYVHYGVPRRAQRVLQRIVQLRSESTEFGPSHPETVLAMEHLRRALLVQHKHGRAGSVRRQIAEAKRCGPAGGDAAEPSLGELCASNQCAAMDHVCDMILDPSKGERLEEARQAELVEESRAIWLRARRAFFVKG